MLILISTAFASPETLTEVVLRIDDKALARFEQCLEIGEEADRFTEWQARCEAAIATYYGDDVPKVEARASHMAVGVTRAGPISVGE